MSRVNTILDPFGPRDLSIRPLAEQRRARALIGCHLITLAGLVAFTTKEVLVGVPALAAVDAVGLVFTALSLLVYKRFGRLDLSANAIGGLIFVVCCVLMALSGGVGLPAPFILGLIPMCVLFMSGPRWGLMWAGLCLLAIVGLGLAHAADVPFPVQVEGSRAVALLVVGSLLNLVLATGMSLANERIKEESFHHLEEINARLAEAENAARAANDAKSAFLANTSHEVRTPLNGVLGTLDILLDNPSVDHDARELIRAAHGSASSLLTILNDIVDLSRVEAGRIDFEQVPYDLRQLVVDVCRLFGSVERPNRSTIEIEADGGPWNVVGDPVRVRQVLSNLVGNAVKFTPEGRVTARLHRDGEDLVVDVVDDGVGVAPARLSEIFEVFTQADASTTRRFGGAGLGLAVSRRLARGMGGDVSARSELGEGSCFSLRLPWRPAPEDWVPEDPRPSAPSIELPAGVHPVLLVEDSLLNQKVSALILRSFGLEVDIAGDGARALEMAAARDYRVIFMDCHMPQMDGFEATARLRERGVDTPIVALTASAIAQERLRCEEAGMNGFLAKPISRPDLVKVLREWVVEAPRAD